MLPQIADRDTVIVQLMGRMGAWLSLPLGLSIIFASVSTSNSIILTLSSMITRDIFREKERAVVGRVFTLVLTLLVFLFALLRPDYIVELSVASSRILLVFLPLFWGLFHGRRGAEKTGLTVLIGGAACAILTSVFGLALSSVYTFIAVFLLFFIASRMEPAAPEQLLGEGE
jgi:SSS family solute:Na+ symporter